jgi:hypothetical protein
MTSPSFRLVAAILLVIIIGMSLVGCASNHIRVTEYEGAALPIPGVNAAAGGCAVNSEGAIPGRLIYQGKTCAYDSAPDSADVE